jgi:hypothetical protein
VEADNKPAAPRRVLHSGGESYNVQFAPNEQRDCRRAAIKQLLAARDNGIEHLLGTGGRARNDAQDVTGGGLLLSSLPKLAPGLGEFLRQLLNPAFRRGKIVGRRSCHDCTLPIQLARVAFSRPMVPASQ